MVDLKDLLNTFVIRIDGKIFKNVATKSEKDKFKALESAIEKARELGLSEIEVVGFFSKTLMEKFNPNEIKIRYSMALNKTIIQWGDIAKNDLIVEDPDEKTIVLSLKECAQIQAFIYFGLANWEWEHALNLSESEEDHDLKNKLEYYKKLAEKFN